MMDRIGLGTVQMGLKYGITNTTGKISDAEAKKIFLLAQDVGLNLLDTALQYGDSEKVLGRTLPENHNFHIVTKTPFLGKNTDGTNPSTALSEAFIHSLNSLNLNHLYGLLIHNMDDLRGPNGQQYINAMIDLRETGKVEKIGVSVYEADDIDFILSQFKPDIVQLPINIADQRLLHTGHIHKLKELEVEIHARSLFWQGLLLMNSDHLPLHLTPLRGYINRFNETINDAGVSKLEACLSFGLGIPEIDKLIIGVNSLTEFSDLIKTVPKAGLRKIDFNSLALHDKKYLNPASWTSMSDNKAMPSSQPKV